MSEECPSCRGSSRGCNRCDGTGQDRLPLSIRKAIGVPERPIRNVPKKLEGWDEGMKD